MIVYYCLGGRQLDQRTRQIWLRELPYVKRLQISRLRDPVAATQSLVGLQLLRHALADRGIRVDLGRLRFGASGKPRLERGPDFSLSHSGGLVACAVSWQRGLGLDVERIRPLGARSLRHALTPEELHWASSDPERLIRLWTAKEAVLKAAGCGLRDLDRVEIRGYTGTLAGEVWYLQKVPLPAGYLGCLAVRRPVGRTVSQEIDSAELEATAV